MTTTTPNPPDQAADGRTGYRLSLDSPVRWDAPGFGCHRSPWGR
ncbi:MAG TPA: hypothetical protein VFA45_21505 [Actinomycetes bacterium]|nr:hypothetical protein [Actinomycetes bacterium]